MSIENDENPALKPKDLIFILAIAGRIDAQARSFAKHLHDKNYIYYLYAGADSLSSSYSMFKYFFDICLANNDPNALHDLLLTPGAIIAITIESVFLVGFSVLAALFEDEKKKNDNEAKNSLKVFIAESWPYFRHVIKGLKNAYKGWRSAVVVLSLLGALDVKFLILPVGLTLGLVAVANRLWSYHMMEARKSMMKRNGRLLLEFTELHLLNEADRKEKLALIQYQELHTRIIAYIAVGLGGFIDGLYLYVGVLTLAALSSPLLITMATICAFYTLSCIVTRVYEEYDYQVKLFITQTQCQLALLTKRLETSYVLLLKLKAKPSKTLDELNKIKKLEKEFASLVSEFEQHRNKLKQYYSHNYFTAALLGLKHGLYAYGALASVIFLTSAILVLSGVGFPPALIIFSVFAGLVLISGFIIHSLVANSPNINPQYHEEESAYSYLLAMKKDIGIADDFVHLVDIEEFRASLKDGLSVPPSKQYFFQEWLEVLRSFFSGVTKGQKFIDFAGNPLQELDEQGHYQDTPIMFVLAALNGLFFAVALGLRALAKGFGKPPIVGEVKLTDAVTITVKTPQPASPPAPVKEIATPKTPKEPNPKGKRPIEVIKRKYSEHFSYFKKGPSAPRARLPHSKSEGSFRVADTPTPQNIAPGLG